ncbi:ATPase family AAA domain-containing protein 5 isoform X2 [Melanotaenia boesemani]|uniref:ATPase family AAA domain-containing protein 5 isoform X2 n=1 Tax=Melanotaenia boesemani TaxID=1250792 RepID=UPI001C047722|nr:ATPase family AAA domain-containing protein 5 isoform X2 [Melanotaenia boesemani]
MAGVVAMASVIEDFDTQPCKKSRKDGGSPVVKTIPNYFSPVPKPVEKPFSPPRSNKIMNYFSRKTPSSKEKTNSPEQSKENCQSSHSAEKHTSPEVGKQPSQKRRRKTSKAARKLVAAETVSVNDNLSCFIVEESRESKDSEADGVGSCGILGNDTEALMLKISAEDRVTAETSGITDVKTSSDEQAERDEPPEDSSKCENSVKPESPLNTTELSPAVSTKSEVKRVKAAPRKDRRKQQREVKHPEEKEAESSQCGSAKEDSLDEASQLNKSTVKISFEDFLRSQNEVKTEEDVKDDKGKEDISKITADKVNSGQLDIPKDGENVVSLVPSVQISPRTVTIKAEVHAVSPKHEAVKLVGNFASIFNRKKSTSSPAEKASSPAETGHQFPSSSVKRKSNVVLQEEDLEVVVLESESTPKCSEKERKQFMAAFKQPSLDGSKTKPAKSQSKQKQAAEKILDAADKVAENDTAAPTSVKEVCLENKAATKKPANKGRNKAKDKKEAAEASPAVEETSTAVVDVDNKSEEPPTTSTPSAVRRSRRETVVRQALQPTPTTPARKTRRQTGSDAAVTAASPQDSPLKISAPKTPKSKHGVFVAEIVCSPDVKQSPIRIKFSRVRKNVSASKTDGGNDKSSSVTNETSSKSEKRKQAKKLVEKAKVIQQSKKTSVEENTPRRSSRTKTSVKRSYCEDEDSVICVEDLSTSPQTPAEKSKTQKPLRSLNDVLGKATAATKEAKAHPVASLGQEKSARKVSAVISIFDDSSQDGSENSQDDEQFRARREFLKSGLPECFKKQIAKTAATKEAYSLSCSSFQPITHTTQQNNGPFWNLPWPESSALSHLKELWSPTLNPLPHVTGSLCVKTVPACRNFGEKGSGWRSEIPESVCQLLMEELSTSNPHFPAQMHISRLLKRRTDHQQQLTASEQVAATKDGSSTPSLAESVGGKRKRKDDEGGNLVKVAKKQRSTHSEENVSVAEPKAPKRGGRTRRAQRSRLEEEEEGMKDKTKSSLTSAPSTSEDDAVIVIDDLIMVEDAIKKDVVMEDVLWTDKYQPQHSSDIIDNTTSVKKLHSWLKEWKLRADREERTNQKVKKHEEGSNDSDWDCGEENGEDMLCNTMLITGPTGVGKTAAVYACAQELGFKVFEVNASSQRSGRLILSQLKEATQSHQVDSQGVNAHKPTYFNSYGTSSSAGAIKPGSSPRKVNSPRRVVSSPRKHPQSPRGAKKGGLAPMSLANFFKMGQPTNKEPPNTKKNEQTAASKKVVKANESGRKNKDPAAKSPAAEKTTEEQSKKTATSLILFEEVDVIFEDDSGFLAAIKTFMTTAKRPVILTTSDPAFSSMFDGCFDEIHFKTPSVLNAGSYLQLLCLAENVRTNPSDVASLLRLNGCDIRQSLLQLQFWARSAGGQYSTKSLMHAGKNAETKPETEESADKPKTELSDLPPCDTGCTESKLGLLNMEPERDIWELFKSQSLMEETVCWELLTHSRQRGVDLLYSNMETLLPLPLTELNTSKPEHCVSLSQDQQPLSTPLQSDTLPPTVTSLHTAESADCSDSGSPVKVSSRMKKYKKRHCLPEQDGLHSESDSEDGFPSLCKPQSRPQAEEKVETHVVSENLRRKLLTPEERIKSFPVSQCLESLADFLDNMSYIDSSLLFHPLSRNNHSLSTVSAVIKDGMTDESRVETDGGSRSTQGCVLEVQAAVEALSFHKCQALVAKAWDKVQQLEGELGKEAAAELALPVAAHRESYSFTPDGPCPPQLIQRRRELMESLMFRGVFGSFGNKPAAALDYLPVMRTICRSEQLKEQGKVKRRFLHYLNAIILGLEKSTLQLLAKDFP